MPLNIDWQQILLHLLNFALLCGGLYLLLYKPVKNFMAKRLTQYETREAETRQREADADAMKEKYQSMLRQAEQEILARREKVGEELEEEKRQQLAEARAEARKILSTAAKTAELRTKKALEDSHEEIRALAIGMVERMVVENSGDALDQFLNEAEGGAVKPQKTGGAEAAKAAKPQKSESVSAASAVKSDTVKVDAAKPQKTEGAEASSVKADAVKTEPAAPARKPAARSRGKGKAASSRATDSGSSAADSVSDNSAADSKPAAKSKERGTRRG